MRIRFSRVLAIPLLMGGCQPNTPPGPAPVAQPAAADEFIHAPSDFRFPPTVTGFVRETVRYYDRDRLNVSVGYNLAHTAALTVYVYPMQQTPERTLEDHFAAVKKDIAGRQQDAVIVAEGPQTSKIGEQERAGHHAAFTYTTIFAQRMQSVRSELYLFKLGRWFVKYRVTCAVGDQATVEPAVKSFIEQWRWPTAE